MASKSQKTQADPSMPAMPAARPEVWPLDKIIPYPNNPRTHPADQVALLAKLITRHGIDQPIVIDEDGFILKGHGRRMAAVEAGLKSFPVVIHHGLSEDEKRAIRLSDNQVALLSGWDANLLRVELTDLKTAGFDMALLGFDNVQLVSFMSVPSSGDPELVPEPPIKPVSRAGDVWIMGKHRLLCGDSTKAEDVEKVLAGEKPNLMVTDPPYGVDYDPIWREGLGRDAEGKVQRITSGKVVHELGKATASGLVQNDDRSDWRDAWKLFPGNVAYVWSASLHTGIVQISLEGADFFARAQIIWNKQAMVFGRGDYHWKHEPCWYAVRKGSPSRWSGDRKQTTVWDIQNHNPMGGNRDEEQTGHGTQKPVECMKRPIENSSRPGEFVYEPFSGSGTTLIACEMTTRYCLAIELAPEYVDVAVVRWQAFAKAEAILEGDGRTFAAIAKARAKKKTGSEGKASKPVPKAKAAAQAAR